MTLYIFKVILASGLLYLVYHFLFEKESMHKFKRAYLLLAIIGSVLIPLVPMPSPSVEPIANVNLPLVPLIANQDIVAIENIAPTMDSSYILSWLYCIIALALFAKTYLNIYLLRKGALSKRIVKENYIIILKDEPIVPHSFWNTIYINKNDYEQNRICDKILKHELTHIKQKHSLDIIL